MWLKWQYFDIQCRYNFVHTQHSSFLHRASKLQVTNIAVLASIITIKRCFLFLTGPIIRTKFQMWGKTHYLSPMNKIQSNLLIYKYCFVIKILHNCFKSAHNNLGNYWFVTFFIIRPKFNIYLSISFTTVKVDIQKYCGLYCLLRLSDQATNALIVQPFLSDIVT